VAALPSGAVAEGVAMTRLQLCMLSAICCSSFLGLLQTCRFHNVVVRSTIGLQRTYIRYNFLLSAFSVDSFFRS
jgi:hypothetical protein